MGKKFLSVLVIGLFLAGLSVTAYAMTCCAQAEETKGAGNSKAVNAGNKFCPVTGEPIDNMTTYEYKGKIYNFCCPQCINAFKANPGKYSVIAEQEGGSEHSMQEGHQHSY